jgi:hypothetical protein
MSLNERSTTATKLSDDKWTSIGQGPAIVGAYGSEILFAAGDIEPGADDIGLVLRFDAPPLQVQAQIRLWAGRASAGAIREPWFCPSTAWSPPSRPQVRGVSSDRRSRSAVAGASR